MATITCFEEIEAWQTARSLTKRISELTGEGSFARDFGLRDQMRRAPVSIMSNIDELFELADKCSRQISRFMTYLQTNKGRAR
jgi:four helix bundle protein